MKNLTLTLLLATTFTLNAVAGTLNDFSDLYDQVMANCAYECEGGEYKSVLFMEDGELIQELPAEAVKNLTEAAEHQANVWGDTIYEGDYMPKGEVELNSIEGIYHQGNLIMYRITYSQSAWATGACDIDWEQEEPSFEDCTAGYVSETSLVSVDFKDVEMDGNRYAEFND